MWFDELADLLVDDFRVGEGCFGDVDMMTKIVANCCSTKPRSVLELEVKFNF